MGIYRTRYPRAYDPLVSIVIPNKDHVQDLKQCIASIEEKSTYRNYELVIVENNSEEKETFAYYETLEQENPKVRVIRYEGEFHYSEINNLGAQHAQGEYLVLLNNDTEVISETWLEELLGCSMRPDVGATGARLYYGDDTVQHAGIVLGAGGIAGNSSIGQSWEDVGEFQRLVCARDVSAVTAACLMVRKAVYEQVGGLSTELPVAFNDVDFCLKVQKAGYRVVYNPYAELYHYESKSRGTEDTPEKKNVLPGRLPLCRNAGAKNLQSRIPIIIQILQRWERFAARHKIFLREKGQAILSPVRPTASIPTVCWWKGDHLLHSGGGRRDR